MTDIFYGKDTGQMMPKNFLTSHKAWDDFVSDIWAGVLISQGLRSNDCIVEIGPGASTKIGGALAKVNFKGVLYVLDASDSVLKGLKPKYDDLLPKVRVIYIDKPVDEALMHLPANVDVVLGSHIVDDMMIYSTEKEALKWSETYTHGTSDALQLAWKSLLNDITHLEQIKGSVENTIFDMCEVLDPRILILNQYPSATLSDNDMGTLNDHALDVLMSLKSRKQPVVDIQNSLNQTPHYQNAHIGNNVLNARNWLVCKTT